MTSVNREDSIKAGNQSPCPCDITRLGMMFSNLLMTVYHTRQNVKEFPEHFLFRQRLKRRDHDSVSWSFPLLPYEKT